MFLRLIVQFALKSTPDFVGEWALVSITFNNIIARDDERRYHPLSREAAFQSALFCSHRNPKLSQPVSRTVDSARPIANLRCLGFSQRA